MDYVKLEGGTILPARVEGTADVFQNPHFVLVKPKWVPDETSTHCELCSTKFSQIKRRHHCRMCGAVRCARCCNEKIPLPQLGIEEAERVCESCRTVTELVTKSRSSIDSFLLESAKGLASFARHEKHVKKLVELGGSQTLVALGSLNNITILGFVASGIHSLSTHPSLHKHLADTGAIKAICKILNTSSDNNEQIAVDAISALVMLCKTPTLKIKVLNDGALQPILSLCWSEKEAISLLSVGIIGLIAENPATHSAMFDNKNNALTRLLHLTTSTDEQMQEVALRTLALLSTGTPENNHRLVQEDFSSGHSLYKVFDSTPNNPQILCNAACLVANLATSAPDQTGLQELMHTSCRKLVMAESNPELLCHITRALANFAEHKQNVSYLLHVIPDVINHCLTSAAQPVKLQSIRLLLTLLGHAPARVSSLLIGDGAQPFLAALGEMTPFLNAVQSSLANEAPSIARPL